jgi:hypothetical protein
MQAVLGARPGRMQQAQTIQATISDLHRSFFSWTMHSGKVFINESGEGASGSPFSGATFSSNISCKRPRKNGAHAEEEIWLSSIQDAGQNHSPECPLMRHEQAPLTEESSKILRGSLSGEDSALGIELRQEQDDSRILKEEADVACGCSVSHSATWTQGWHPRVDNSALGYEDAGLSGLQDVVSCLLYGTNAKDCIPVGMLLDSSILGRLLFLMVLASCCCFQVHFNISFLNYVC